MGEIEQLNTFDLFIFGGTGDLANRKLLPALYKQSSIKSFSSDSRIIIIGTKNLTTEEYLQKLNKSLQEYSADYSNEMAEKFFSKISYLKIDVNNNEDWKNFSAQKYNNTRIFYLAMVNKYNLSPNLKVKCAIFSKKNAVRWSDKES